MRPSIQGLALAVTFVAACSCVDWARSQGVGTVAPTARTPNAVASAQAAWTSLPPPSARMSTCVALDSRRHRWIVFGGYGPGGVDTSAVWALPASSGDGWQFIAAAGTPPPAGIGRAAAYDPVRDRFIVAGSFSGGLAVWALSLSAPTPTWTTIEPDNGGLVARMGHSATYDPVRDRLLVFGGFCVFDIPGAYHFEGAVNDFWALSLSGTPHWTALPPSEATYATPAPRYTQVAAYDAARDRLLVFGGAGNGHRYADTWAYDLAGGEGWTALQPSNAGPTGRYGPAGGYDASGDRLVVFGGYDGTVRADTWTLSLAGTPAWAQIAPADSAPSARFLHAASVDPSSNRMLVYGGRDSSKVSHSIGILGVRGDATVLALGNEPAWIGLSGSPAPRRMHSAAFDAANNRIVVFGGLGNATPNVTLGDLWSLTLSTPPAWHKLTAAGTPPSARYGHSAIYDAAGKRMIVFGGRDSAEQKFADVWSLSLTGTPAWTQLSPTGGPPAARYGHGAAYDAVHGRMLVLGGMTLEPSIWQLSLTGGMPAWSAIDPAGGLDVLAAGLFCPGLVYDPSRDRLVVFGGAPGSTGWWFNVGDNRAYAATLSDTPQWSELSAANPPSGRVGPGCVYDAIGDRLLVYGGSPTFDTRSYTISSDVLALPLGTADAWSTLLSGPIYPSAFTRFGHTATWDPVHGSMIVIGGQSYTDTLESSCYAIALGGTAAVATPLPAALRLAPPRPNPAHGASTLAFELPAPTRVTLDLFDVGGRRIARLVDGPLPAGRHERVWNGRDASGHPLGAGVYFARLDAGGEHATRRLVRLGGVR